MVLRRCGRSGLALPALSLGLWQNFGTDRPWEVQRALVLRAFDLGIVHLDLANNYGPPPGAAEEALGRLLATDLRAHRDELVITTKAGYRMGPGPYGEGGSRKYLLSSLDASLRRLGLDEVDIFYSHRFDPTTPLAETMGALATAVTSGRARYAGISSYSAERTAEAVGTAGGLGLRLVAHQPSYSMLNRWIEEGEPSLLDVTDEHGLGVVAFSALAQGLLTDRYLDGVPPGSRGSRAGPLRPQYLSEQALRRVRALHAIALGRGQTLAQLAVAWVLRDPRVTTALVGASSVTQLEDTVRALHRLDFSPAELEAIDAYAVDSGVDHWARYRRE
jgi:L-glyceraldehyde 3-phosphate reductase